MTKCDYCDKENVFTITDAIGNSFCNSHCRSKFHDRNIIELLQEIQNNEINFRIECFYDNGFTVSIGDCMNGFTWKACFYKLNDALHALIKKAKMRE